MGTGKIVVTGSRNSWVLGRREENGTWIAHCLDLDVRAWADTLWDALDAVEAAVSKAIRSDARRGREPFARAQASKSEWDRLWTIVHDGVLMTEEDLVLSRAPLSRIATQLEIDVLPPVRIRRAPAALVA